MEADFCVFNCWLYFFWAFMGFAVSFVVFGVPYVKIHCRIRTLDARRRTVSPQRERARLPPPDAPVVRKRALAGAFFMEALESKKCAR